MDHDAERRATRSSARQGSLANSEAKSVVDKSFVDVSVRTRSTLGSTREAEQSLETNAIMLERPSVAASIEEGRGYEQDAGTLVRMSASGLADEGNRCINTLDRLSQTRLETLDHAYRISGWAKEWSQRDKDTEPRRSAAVRQTVRGAAPQESAAEAGAVVLADEFIIMSKQLDDAQNQNGEQAEQINGLEDRLAIMSKQLEDAQTQHAEQAEQVNELEGRLREAECLLTRRNAEIKQLQARHLNQGQKAGRRALRAERKLARRHDEIRNLRAKPRRRDRKAERKANHAESTSAMQKPQNEILHAVSRIDNAVKDLEMRMAGMTGLSEKLAAESCHEHRAWEAGKNFARQVSENDRLQTELLERDRRFQELADEITS